MIYGYVRISRPTQSIERQIRNILKEYPDAKIYQEAWTGTVMARPEWQKLLKRLKSGDCIVFDSVSRMSRNAAEGTEAYMDLYRKGIGLVFLKEHHIDTSVYEKSLTCGIEQFQIHSGNDAVDQYFTGQIQLINALIAGLAAEQIRIAFEQSEKEVKDLQQRTREGIETARLAGKQIGQESGRKLHIKKKEKAKQIIKKHSKRFGGGLTAEETWKLANISKVTYYKYAAEVEAATSNLRNLL